MAIAVHDASEPGAVAITFTLTSDDVSGPVSVVGSFNDWRAGRDPFSDPDEEGSRACAVTVPAGRPVHFRYLGEGDVWFDDDDADEITPNGSILLLPSAGAGDDDGVGDDRGEPVAGGLDESAETGSSNAMTRRETA